MHHILNAHKAVNMIKTSLNWLNISKLFHREAVLLQMYTRDILFFLLLNLFCYTRVSNSYCM